MNEKELLLEFAEWLERNHTPICRMTNFENQDDFYVSVGKTELDRIINNFLAGLNKR